MTRLGVGILVGGKGSRLGGVAKGMLRLSDGTTLVERLALQVRVVAPDAPLYLLGNRPEYRELSFARLPDDPSEVGPIGGLHALLKQPFDEVLLLGGDLPHVTASLIGRLLAVELTTAVAMKSGAPPRWEPMLSRYAVTKALPVVQEQLRGGALGLFTLLDRLGASALEVSEAEAPQLLDWDRPEDIDR